MLRRLIQSLKQFNPLAEPTIRHYWVYLRALYFIRIRRRLRTLDSGDAVKANVLHNMRSIYGANRRMNLLLFPLAIIETLNVDSRILIIGPRNEFDLYSLAGLGFRIENMVGLDLISYSPYVKLGDMHSIPFDDHAFDAVVCGWTLSYSTNPRRAALEMVRVTRPGGIVAIGVEYSNLGPEDEKKLLGYQLQEFDRIEKRINSTADIKTLFEGEIGHVYFEHDAPLKISHSAEGLSKTVSNAAVVFSRPSVRT
jgi:SAM-dependent methyltransferase